MITATNCQQRAVCCFEQHKVVIEYFVFLPYKLDSVDKDYNDGL